MRPTQSFFTFAAGVLTGFWFVAAVFLAPGFAVAADQKRAVTSFEDKSAKPKTLPKSTAPSRSAAPSCQCPDQRERMAKPKFAALPGRLDESDELAALASLHMALNSAGDGQAYVWQRDNGKLSGFIKPVSTFRNGDKQICRHIQVMLTTGFRTERIESTACRQSGGQWKLEG